MERITVDGCLLVVGSSDLGGNAFSLENLVSQTSTSSASLKVICQKMSRKPKDKEPAKKESKQFDLGGKRR